jgi:hypothetical protein
VGRILKTSNEAQLSSIALATEEIRAFGPGNPGVLGSFLQAKKTTKLR